MAAISLLALLFWAVSILPVSSEVSVLAPFEYELLPIGQLKPGGWMKDQLELEASGLSGHLFDFYRFVKDSLWLGGTTEYSTLHETAPYWYNGLVPLAYVLDDNRLKGQVNQFLNYTLSHQFEDGWLGPESESKDRGIWARLLLLQGMANHAIADESREDEIVTAMHRFVNLTHSMLQNNYTGYWPHEGDVFDGGAFGMSRAHEYSTTLQWLYEYHPRGQEQTIWEVMDLMWSGATESGYDWRTFFVEEAFPRGASNEYSPTFEHGVNLAEGLRYMSQMWRMRKDDSLVQQTRQAIDMTFKYHVGPSGVIIADEYLGGLNPQRGSELCMSVETLFSMNYLYRLHGDNDYADKAETVAFNALPAGIAPDWWSHQYVTQINQPWSKNLSGDPWFDVNTYANVFGLEPNYPCCTVNHPQAYPKFAASAVTRKNSTGLLHQFLIPFSLSTELQGAKVDIKCDTQYPFRQKLSYSISTESSFDFFVRVPSWITKNATAKLNDDEAVPFMVASGNSYQVRVPKGDSILTINLGFQLRVVPQNSKGSVSVFYGPLLYSLDIPYTTTATPVRRYYDESTLPGDQILPQTHDHIIQPESNNSWMVAIDPTQLQVNDRSNDTEELPSPIFDRGAPPIDISVAAVGIEWPITNGTASAPPTNFTKVGQPFVAKMVPYGSAKLHLAELPTVNLPGMKLR